MHELKITGETPDQLYFNVINTLSLFLRGPAQTTTAADKPKMPPDDGLPEPAKKFEDTFSAEQLVVDAIPDSPQAKFEALKAKAKEKKTAKAKVEKMPVDEVGDLGVKTIEHEPKVLTLDGDIRPRLQAIQAACTKRGRDMAACVSYIQKLYGPFGIANAKQLKEEQFAEFMKASEGYLSGEA